MSLAVILLTLFLIVFAIRNIMRRRSREDGLNSIQHVQEHITILKNGERVVGD